MGCDYLRDDEVILCMDPKTCIEKKIDGYTNIFNKKPSSMYKSPFENGDRPELYTTKLLDKGGIQ